MPNIEPRIAPIIHCDTYNKWPVVAIPIEGGLMDEEVRLHPRQLNEQLQVGEHVAVVTTFVAETGHRVSMNWRPAAPAEIGPIS